jgi:two-component sensor histidine kinase
MNDADLATLSALIRLQGQHIGEVRQMIERVLQRIATLEIAHQERQKLPFFQEKTPETPENT